MQTCKHYKQNLASSNEHIAWGMTLYTKDVSRALAFWRSSTKIDKKQYSLCRLEAIVEVLEVSMLLVPLLIAQSQALHKSIAASPHSLLISWPRKTRVCSPFVDRCCCWLTDKSVHLTKTEKSSIQVCTVLTWSTVLRPSHVYLLCGYWLWLICFSLRDKLGPNDKCHFKGGWIKARHGNGTTKINDAGRIFITATRHQPCLYLPACHIHVNLFTLQIVALS